MSRVQTSSVGPTPARSCSESGLASSKSSATKRGKASLGPSLSCRWRCGCAPRSTCALNHLRDHAPTHSRAHPATHLPSLLLTHSLGHIAHLPTRSPSPFHPPTHPLNLFTHVPTHPLTCSLARSLAPRLTPHTLTLGSTHARASQASCLKPPPPLWATAQAPPITQQKGMCFDTTPTIAFNPVPPGGGIWGLSQWGSSYPLKQKAFLQCKRVFHKCGASVDLWPPEKSTAPPPMYADFPPTAISLFAKRNITAVCPIWPSPTPLPFQVFFITQQWPDGHNVKNNGFCQVVSHSS